MSTKRPRSPSPSKAQDIYRSSTITENHSTFTAAFSPTLSHKTLQSLPDFKSATHRIAAWRKRTRQTTLKGNGDTLYNSGHDDDGESWAGSKLERAFKIMNVEEGAVVVARWYGGVNIGPIRFTHIENCAREAIWAWKTATQREGSGQLHQPTTPTKKAKIDEETALKELRQDLKERDINIGVLRTLLAKKNAKLKGEEVTPPTPQKVTPDYGKMGLEALKRLDKARDATVAFILKQIDKVDEELNALGDAFEQSIWEDSNDADDHQTTGAVDGEPNGEDAASKDAQYRPGRGSSAKKENQS